MKKRFMSTIARAGRKNLIPVPFAPNDAWGQRERHYVDGEVDGHRVRGLLIVDVTHIALPVGAAWLRDTQLAHNIPVKVVLWPDGPQVELLAEDLARALEAAPAAKALFESVATFYRKNFLRWIDSAKRPETRQTRIAEMVRLFAAGEKQR